MILLLIQILKKFQTLIKELFFRCKKLSISLVFITKFYFSTPNNVRLNSTYYLIMETHDKVELKNIATNHSTDIDYEDFMKIYKKYATEVLFFLTVDTKLPADNSLRFRKNLLHSLYK